MSLLVFAGSAQYVTVNFSYISLNPIYVLLTLIVMHVFIYGISMLISEIPENSNLPYLGLR